MGQECPICLGEISLGIETNCGHVFCGNCIVTYTREAQHGPLGTPTCPYCRQRMTLLLPYFTRDEREQSGSLQRQELMEKIRIHNRLFSDAPRSWMEHINDLPVLTRHLLRYLTSFNSVDIFFRLRLLVFIVLAFLYFISPLDLIPEGLFGLLGFLDDFMVVGMVLFYSINIYRGLIAQHGLA